MLHLLIALTLAAQATPVPTSCVQGLVVDDTARPLPFAQISLLKHGQGVVSSGVLTDWAGGFAVVDLPAGDYWLIVERVGFEPEVVDLKLTSRQASTTEVRLRPIRALVERVEGRIELPWIERAMARDPLRWREGSHLDSGVDPVQGRVAWNAVSGEGAGGEAVTGSHAQVEIEGNVRSDLSWYVDGHMDDLQYRTNHGLEAVDSGRIEYGVGLSEVGQGLSFRGELVRQSSLVGDGDVWAEQRQSYAVDFSSGTEQHEIGLAVSYHQAFDEATTADTEVPIDRHSVWEGRARFVRQLADGHLLRTGLLLRAQQWSAVNSRILENLLPVAGVLYDRDLQPSPWQAMLSKSYEWQVSNGSLMTAGLDLAHVSGDGGGSLIRPRLGWSIDFDRVGRFDVESSVLHRTPPPEAYLAAMEVEDHSSLGIRFAYEMSFGTDGRLRVEAARNGHRELVDLEPGTVPDQEYLVFSRGTAQSREVGVNLRSTSRAGLRGFAGVTYGVARGDVSLLPAYRDRARSRANLHGEQVRYASAKIGGELEPTGTDVVVRYRWVEGLWHAGDDLDRVDVELDQGLPFEMLGSARIALQLAVRGYLRRAAAGAEEQPSAPGPLFTAGVAVSF